MSRVWLLFLGIALGVCFSACSSGGGGGGVPFCSDSGIGCACSPQHPCEHGLACRSQICIDLDDGPRAGTDADSGRNSDGAQPMPDAAAAPDAAAPHDAATSGSDGAANMSDAAGDAMASGTGCYHSVSDYAEMVCEDDVTCTAPTFTQTAAGNVATNCCGLEWRKSTSAPTQYNWDAASTYCSGLEVGGGWRLPTAPELLSLIDGCTAPVLIDTVAFPDTPIEHAYWSSTSAMPGVHADAVDFGTGQRTAMPVAFALYVRCVRTP